MRFWRRTYRFAMLLSCIFISGCNPLMDENSSGSMETSAETDAWYPFDDMSDVTVYEYDPNNILGLKAIYIGENKIIYQFTNNIISKEDVVSGVGFNEEIIEFNDYKIIKNDYTLIEISCHELEKLNGIKVELTKEWNLLRLYSFNRPKLYLWKGKYNNNFYVGDAIMQTYDENMKEWCKPQEDHEEYEIEMHMD